MHTVFSCVEDNSANLMLLHAVLGSSSYRLHDARTIKAAMQLLGEREYSLVLLDLMLPDGSGLDVARHLRRTPSTMALPIVVMTASVRESDREEAMAVGCNVFLQKPFSPSSLRHAVAELLSQPQARSPA